MGFFSSLLPPVLISLICISAPCADAWGSEGHTMICRIAENYLTENATRAVSNLLGGRRLSELCSWADEVRGRPEYRWSARLHYVNTPGVCNFNYRRDCRNGECVVGAIYKCYAELRAKVPKRPGTLNETLLFLAHFMGDIHQPLHVGFRNNTGGLRILVDSLWPGYRGPHNLHYVWDTIIKRTALARFYNHDLNASIQCIEEKYIEGKCIPLLWPIDYAQESITLACGRAYVDASTGYPVWTRPNLTGDYFIYAFPVVEKRIAEAGKRLADRLNDIFSPRIQVERMAY